MHTNEQIEKARAMAEDFAKRMTPDILKSFLSDSGIADDLYKANSQAEGFKIEPERWLKLLTDDYNVSYGRGLAIAYSLGFLDAKANEPTNLYRRVSSKSNE